MMLTMVSVIVITLLYFHKTEMINIMLELNNITFNCKFADFRRSNNDDLNFQQSARKHRDGKVINITHRQMCVYCFNNALHFK